MEALLSRQQDSQWSFPLTPSPGGGGAHLETLAGNPVLWDLHLHEKKIKKSKQEQGGQRGKEYNNILQIVLGGFFALTPNFPPYISLLLQPRDLVLSLSLNFYVPVIQKLEML